MNHFERGTSFVQNEGLHFEQDTSLTLNGRLHRILILDVRQIHAILVQQNVAPGGEAKLQLIALSQF